MNTSFKFPCFYHPTTAILVDDNQFFLENLPINLNDKAIYHTFDNPYDALTFLKPLQNLAPAINDFSHTLTDLTDELDLNQHAVSIINLSNIHKKLYHQSRFNIPSVVIVDHDMPGMTGIEFCKHLKDYPIKKIMLTGVADHKIAIQAFNDGIIHKFIMKDDANLFTLINTAINEMQADYFFDFSKLITQNIAASSFSYLKDERFLQFVTDFFKKHLIIEFYLIDPIGSFLLIDVNGEPLWFIVKSDQDFSRDHQIAVDYNASTDIIDTLAQRNKLLFLFSEKDHKQSVNQWASYLHIAHKIETIKGCYYALIQGKPAYQVDGVLWDNIVTYNNNVRNVL